MSNTVIDVFEEVRQDLPDGARWLYELLEAKINQTNNEDVKYELGQKQYDLLIIYM